MGFILEKVNLFCHVFRQQGSWDFLFNWVNFPSLKSNNKQTSAVVNSSPIVHRSHNALILCSLLFHVPANYLESEEQLVPKGSFLSNCNINQFCQAFSSQHLWAAFSLFFCCRQLGRWPDWWISLDWSGQLFQPWIQCWNGKFGQTISFTYTQKNILNMCVMQHHQTVVLSIPIRMNYIAFHGLLHPMTLR